MPENISLLPEELRKKEEERAKQQPPKEALQKDLRFTIPKEEAEDVEVIEVDEGEVDQVLSAEPGVSKFIFRLTELFDGIKQKLFQPPSIEPPPKIPPQFLESAPRVKPAGPVVSSSVIPTSASSAGTSTRMGSAIVKPFAAVPKRVRVIRRVRKPVRVSFVSEDDLRLLHIDVSKRRFTFILLCVLFALLIGGGDYALRLQADAAKQETAKAESQLVDVRARISQQQEQWSSFQDLEPKLQALRQLLNEHISPTQLFGSLERNTLPTVSYGSMALTPDRKVSLSVIADSFASAAGQVAVFQQSNFVQKVEANGYAVKYDPPDSSQVKEVTYQMTLTLKPSALTTALVTTSSTMP